MTIGTRIKIEGQNTKAENGVFEITTVIPQPDGDNYILYQRVNKKGEVTTSKSTNNLRGGRASRIQQIAATI